MLTIRLKTLVFLGCLFETVWLLIAQTLGNSMLIIPCLVCFMALAAWGALKGMALPILLYFLPFATLLKTNPGETSFFTIALLIVYVISFVEGFRKISIMHVIPGAMLIGMCLLVKTLHNYSLDKGFILFSLSLLLAPYVANEFGKRYDFYWLTLFFTVGISIAALSSLYLREFSSIARYIEDYELFGVVRHSGYYGDPNFYSAHISAAVSGVLILLLGNVEKKKMIVLMLMLMMLIYCGFLAVSKSFFLILACLVLLFVLDLMFKKGRLSAKLLLILTFSVGAIFLLSSSAFLNLSAMILSRFVGGSNLSDFTTGRTEIWIVFINAFKEDTLLLLFGRGYTDVRIAVKGSHNTVIQVVYQFGLVGCICLVAWLIFCVRTFAKHVKINGDGFVQFCVIMIGVIGPWMALDLLFFDEFFLMPMYVCIGLMSVTNKGMDRGISFRRRTKRLRIKI